MDSAVPRWIDDLAHTLRVHPGTEVDLAKDFDPAATSDGVEKKRATELLEESVALLSAYQDRLAAQDTDGVLLCLQALDAAGKDGTIRHVMSGVNPQGVHVHSFKVPSDEELRHDYLWRYARQLPARGEIGIFNRSHYEEVLVVRVHRELLERQHLSSDSKGEGLWKRRFREINDWERYLAANGIRVLKVLLNVSKEEQRVRFLRRLDLPEHNWKFSVSDIHERGFWDDYQRALSDVLSQTSTRWAPWYVVPADHKWFARICVGAVLVHALAQIDPRYPEVTAAQRQQELEAKAELMAEAPAGASPDPNEPAAG
jgi:PPK2 family polyphosphate:nucleotide phosphotransferase